MRLRHAGGRCDGGDMRWYVAVPLLVSLLMACSHGPAVPREARGVSAPSRASQADRSNALPIEEALLRPSGESVTVLAFLCDDLSHVDCPPCPEDADCAACEPPTWVFCDTPGKLDPLASMSVEDPPPGIALKVGGRYLLKGKISDMRTLLLDAIYRADE